MHYIHHGQNRGEPKRRKSWKRNIFGYDKHTSCLLYFCYKIHGDPTIVRLLTCNEPRTEDVLSRHKGRTGDSRNPHKLRQSKAGVVVAQVIVYRPTDRPNNYLLMFNDLPGGVGLCNTCLRAMSHGLYHSAGIYSFAQYKALRFTPHIFSHRIHLLQSWINPSHGRGQLHGSYFFLFFQRLNQRNIWGFEFGGVHWFWTCSVHL